MNLRKISLICLNHEVYRFVTETKPYNTLTILVITDCLLICILISWIVPGLMKQCELYPRIYSKSKEEFILHFKRTYSEPYPPSWILGELLTIGNVNAIYRNIKQNRIRKRIAKRFGLPINVFESWLTVIAVTRNACGHHSRVWNKQNAIQPAIPNSPAGEWITLPTDSMRAYFDLCIIKYFLNVISPNNDMQSKLTWLFIRFPEIDLKALGFPQGWETEPLWR